jgi:hypothetical protein
VNAELDWFLKVRDFVADIMWPSCSVVRHCNVEIQPCQERAQAA